MTSSISPHVPDLDEWVFLAYSNIQRYCFRAHLSTMALPIPKSIKQWTVVGHSGLESLKYSEGPVPEFGDNQVLVKSMYPAEFPRNEDILVI
jgi:hypothetical protein